MFDSNLWTKNDVVRQIDEYGPCTTKLDYIGAIIGSIFLIRDDGSLLMQLRDEYPYLRHSGLWVPPGGHMNFGETLKDVAIREFREETQLVYKKIQWLKAIEVLLYPWPTYLLGIFWVRYDNQPFKCQEGRDLAFVSPSEATQFPMPHFIAQIWYEILLLTNNNFPKI